jgi:hypothetical protein
MRARAAYISSFGTGGIIVASALLMLATVSALVAFHGWPGGATGDGQIASVPLAPSQAAAPARHVRRASAPTPASAKTTAAAHRSAESRHAASTAGLVKAAGRGVSTATVDLIKVASPTAGPATPPVQWPPPSTGPQRPSPTVQPPSGHQPPQGQPRPRLPVPPIPGGPASGGVQQTVDGVTADVPPLPEQIVLPGDLITIRLR